MPTSSASAATRTRRAAMGVGRVRLHRCCSVAMALLLTVWTSHILLLLLVSTNPNSFSMKCSKFHNKCLLYVNVGVHILFILSQALLFPSQPYCLLSLCLSPGHEINQDLIYSVVMVLLLIRSKCCS
ncbi:hypothetical protein VPH35_028675 [Triticum aestivum]